jgi:hypothetical protein
MLTKYIFISFKEVTMAKIGTQFHAAPDEMINFIKDCMKEYNLYAVIIQSFPQFAAKLTNPVDVVLNNIPTLQTFMVTFYTYKPDLEADNQMDFLEKNPDGLHFYLGKYYENQLLESSIGSIVEDNDTLKIWKKIISKFKKNTYTGAWVVNHEMGTKGYYKNRRYTEGAKKLFLTGVKILQFPGGNHIILSESLESNIP